MALFQKCPAQPLMCDKGLICAIRDMCDMPKSPYKHGSPYFICHPTCNSTHDGHTCLAYSMRASCHTKVSNSMTRYRQLSVSEKELHIYMHTQMCPRNTTSGQIRICKKNRIKLMKHACCHTHLLLNSTSKNT